MGRLKTYLKNVAILTVTGLGLRAAGMFFRVYIAARIGAEGMGLYQLIFTLYSLCITVATAGVSVAATRLAAEELARPQPGRAKGVLGRVMALALAFGFAAGVVQLVLAWPAARYWLGDIRAAPSLALLAPSLPFMAVGSAARGYFFARRKVGPNVVSQIFEQIIRIVLVLLILPGAVQRGVQYACAAVLVGSMVSEVVSTLLVMWYYRRDMNRTFGDAPAQVPRGTSGRIWRILAPVEGGRCLDSALHTVENTLVPACLLAFLGSREESLAQFGALKGMAMPILLFPFSFLTPLATLLMPEVTEAHILGRQKTLETLVGRIMLFTTTFSVLAGGLIALYAYPLGRILYHDETIGFYLAVLAPVLPGMYLDAMGDSILKGLGEEVATFRYSIWDSLIRIGLVILLMPRMGMKGFLFVMICSNVLSALLNIFRIEKVARIRTRWYRWFVQPALIFLISAVLGQGSLRLIGVAGDWPQLLLGRTVTGGLYCLLMLRFGLWDAVQAILARRKPAGSAA